MKKMLFLAPYPCDKTLQEGYDQRVKNIDLLFHEIKRVYLYIYIKGNQSEVVNINDNCEYIKLHLLFDYFKIKKLIKTFDIVYIHSIYQLRFALPFLSKNQQITLDFHGVIPEELAYNSRFFSSKLYSFLEWIASRNFTNIVFVTKSMLNYFDKKYSKSLVKKIYYPIITKNVLNKKDIITIDGIEKNDIIFIYSGNAQSWQRLDKVVDFIKNTKKDNYTYIFLTRDVEQIKKQIQVCNIESSKIYIKTVLPSELASYYEISNYGFLIRDDHVLNRVANPTKMLEYLYFGITPIVDLVDIGDYTNYDFVKYIDYDYQFKKTKSKKNILLSEEYMRFHGEDLYNIILRDN